MNINDIPHDPTGDIPDVGDQNVERLLSQVYRPEMPDPAFIRRVEECVRATAQERAHPRSAPPPFRSVSRRFAWVLPVAAGVAILALALQFLPNGKQPEPPDPSASSSAQVSGQEGVTPGERPNAPQAPVVALGQAIRTEAGQRRRVALTDGSVLYLNQQTRVKIDAERHVTLSAGEVFVEVAPRQPGAAGASFTVQTPQREVSALGTKFAVQTAAAGTGVVVTQGQVRVSGLDKLVPAGQQLVPGSETLAPAPRASHVLAWTKELMAAAESALVPASRYAGGALV